jgi:two-component system phosphate regulon response regulator PhoB
MTQTVLRRVLIVDDESSIRDMVAITLEMAGFEVIQAIDASAALNEIATLQPDLAIIDWMMPKTSGLELCRRLRKNPNTRDIPLILLTARGEEDAKIAGLEVADDYITKPFSTRELVARLKALLRRVTPLGIDEPVEYAGLRLDPVGQKITVFGTILVLSPTEFRLLQLFMTNPNRAFSRGQLLDRVWGGDVYIEDRTVDVHIRRLRKILGEKHSEMIQTVRGTGYRFDPPSINRGPQV